MIGVASLLWFLVRTGTKPSRAAYPCQKAALANASAWLGTLGLPAFLRKPLESTRGGTRPGGSTGSRFLVLLLAAATVAGTTGPVFRLLSEATSGRAGRVIDLTFTGRRQSTGTFSDIYAVRGTNGSDGGFERLVELMEAGGLSFHALIGAEDVVIIKVNSQWDERGGTNSDLVKAIIQDIVAHPDGFRGETVIADNGQAQYGAAGKGGDLDWKANNAVDTDQSMQDVADLFSDRYRVSTALWDPITTTRVDEYSEGDFRNGYVVASAPSPDTGVVVSYPKFETRYGRRISFQKAVWNPVSRSYDTDTLNVINVPVLKSHMTYGVTASVKHYMGVASDQLTRHNAHRSVGTGGMGTQMVHTRLPVLDVLDAIWINPVPGGGPRTRYSEAAATNIVAASRDPVALDYWAAKKILLPAAEKLGYGRTDSLNPDVAQEGAFGDWLRLSMNDRSFYNPSWAGKSPNVVSIRAIEGTLPLILGRVGQIR